MAGVAEPAVYVPGQVPAMDNLAVLEWWVDARDKARTRKRGDFSIAAMTGRGDVKFMWDPDNEVEVEEAKKFFDRMTKEKKFAAFSVKGKDGDKDQKIKTFDPEAGRCIFQEVVLTPPICGGCHAE